MTTPYPFQDEDVDTIIKRGGRQLIAWDPGLGKSLGSLLFALRVPTARPIIIVCPAGLRWNWLHEVITHTGIRAEILEGMKTDKRKASRSPIITIVNYEILWPWMDHLKRLSPKLVVIDEAHFLAGRTSKRCKAVKELCKGVPHILALTGTPIISRPAELWPIMNLLHPKQFPSFWQWAHNFCAMRRTYWGWDWRGASNLDKLNQILQPYMVRRRKIDVLKDLPAKQRTVVPLDIIGRREYEKAVDNFLEWIGDKHPRKLKTALKAQQIVQLGYIKRLAAWKKVRSIISWIDDFLVNDEKIIIFAIHQKVIRRLHKEYPDVSIVVDGNVTGIKRQQAYNKFLQSKKHKILIGNIRAAGTGWSAKGISHIAFAELDWTPGAHIQGEDRACGINRGKEGVATNIYYLVARNTIESKLLEILQKKQKVLNKSIDGDAEADNLNVHELLIQELMKGRNK